MAAICRCNLSCRDTGHCCAKRSCTKRIWHYMWLDAKKTCDMVPPPCEPSSLVLSPSMPPSAEISPSVLSSSLVFQESASKRFQHFLQHICCKNLTQSLIRACRPFLHTFSLSSSPLQLHHSLVSHPQLHLQRPSSHVLFPLMRQSVLLHSLKLWSWHLHMWQI